MKNYYGIVVSNANAISTIRINRPEINCKVNRNTCNAICQAISDANNDDNIKVIIITGTGEYFCGGGEVDNHPNGTLQDFISYSEAFCNLHYAIYDSFKPIIAAVQGKAIAGGFSITEACDIAVCAKSSIFGLPEITHGLFPMIALATTGKTIPKKELLKLSYTAEIIDANKAKEWYIVNEIAEDDKVLDRAREIAQEICQYSADAIAFGRRAYYAMNNMDLRSALEYSRSALLGLLYTDDAISLGDAVHKGELSMDYIKSRK